MNTEISFISYTQNRTVQVPLLSAVHAVDVTLDFIVYSSGYINWTNLIYPHQAAVDPDTLHKLFIYITQSVKTWQMDLYTWGCHSGVQ